MTDNEIQGNAIECSLKRNNFERKNLQNELNDEFCLHTDIINLSRFFFKNIFLIQRNLRRFL